MEVRDGFSLQPQATSLRQHAGYRLPARLLAFCCVELSGRPGLPCCPPLLLLLSLPLLLPGCQVPLPPPPPLLLPPSCPPLLPPGCQALLLLLLLCCPAVLLLESQLLLPAPLPAALLAVP